MFCLCVCDLSVGGVLLSQVLSQVATAIEEGSVHFLSERLLMEFLEQDVMSKIRHLFHMLDMNDDGTISMTELVAAINDPLFRRGLRSIFPTLDPISLLSSATLMDGELGPEQLLGVFLAFACLV